MKQFKIVVERHGGGYVAYPLGIGGAVFGQGDTYENALADVESAIALYIQTFGPRVIESEALILEPFFAQLAVAA